MYARFLALPFLAALSCAVAAPFAYVPSDLGIVSVIDLTTNSVVATIPIPGVNHSGVAVNPAGTRVYVTNTETARPGSVSVIDTATNTVVATIQVGDWPYGVAVSPNGMRVLVMNHFSGSVSVVDAASDAVVATTPIDGQPWGVAINPTGTRAYIANSLSFSAWLFDLGTNAIAAPIPLGSTSRDVAIHPTMGRAYVTDFSAGIRVIDTTTNQPMAVVPNTAGVVALAVNRAGTRLYAVGNNPGAMLVIDTLTNTVLTSVPVDAVPNGVAVDPSGTRVLVINTAAVYQGPGSVTVVDAVSNSVIATIPVSGSPGATGLFIGPAAMPGTGIVSNNPYGALAVTGGTLNGNTISNLQPGAIIQLGNISGQPGSYVEIDFQGFDLAAGNTLTVRSGAEAQKVILLNTSAAPSVVGGTLRAQGGNGAPPPALMLVSGGGATVTPSGTITGPAGLDVSSLGGSWDVGQPIFNQGIIDGGPALSIAGLVIMGGGQFKGDTILLSTITDIRNPVNGAHFLSNGLQLYPSTGNDVALTLHAYGGVPQYLNVAVNGNASVAMPSAWASGAGMPPNNAVVPPGGSRAPGVAEPLYGGGSLIVQAAGSLKVTSGPTNDFVFPGAIVLKAGGALDLNGVTVSQGWTTTGKAFQGIFFESPNITSVGPVSIYSNDLNWTNFSTIPAAHVRISRLVSMLDGTSRYAPADLDAPHRNTYSVLIEAAAAGQCWVCLVNTSPIGVQ